MPAHSASSRRSIRLHRYDYSQSGGYFFTLCVPNRACIFGRVIDYEMKCNRAGDAVWSVWRELPLQFPTVELDAFVVMPNHAHGIVFLRPLAAAGAASSAPTKPTPTLGLVLRAFKSLSTAAVNRALHRTGSLWQRNYYEHIIRSGDELDAIRLYIAHNP
ncbi:MAG TPA: transposase, partial [Candidatus Acidoferrales bacterium]|nr:transposase [Candidatus Acidoferrales bacterium]